MLIEIVRVPNGPAPEEIRKEWVGVQMSAEPIPASAMEADFTINRPIGNRGGFMVRTEVALEALGKKSEEAANWFNQNIPSGMPWLSFGPNEVEIVP